MCLIFIWRNKLKTIICKCGCGREKSVHQADINRGWGKYFSKSCKAKAQEKRTGQYSKLMKRNSFTDLDDIDDIEIGHPLQSGIFGHGQE